jgi:hypothetical protein
VPELQLTLKNIQDLDGGKAALTFNHAVRAAIRDLTDRPGDKSKRRVLMQVNLTPKLDRTTGALDTVLVQFQVVTKIPVQQTLEYPMLPAGDGVLHFQPESPLDPRQPGLDFGRRAAENAVPQTKTDAKKEGEA